MSGLLLLWFSFLIACYVALVKGLFLTLHKGVSCLVPLLIQKQT